MTGKRGDGESEQWGRLAGWRVLLEGAWRDLVALPSGTGEAELEPGQRRTTASRSQKPLSNSTRGTSLPLIWPGAVSWVAWSNSRGSAAMHFGSASPNVCAAPPLRLG
jgi:hypothetical protein